MIFRLLLIGVLCLMMPYNAMAGEKPKESGWADVTEFCESADNIVKNIKSCHGLINRYQNATKKHFSKLSVDNLRRISGEISALADKGSKQSKHLRDAVKDIGDTLRKPIEIPSGVRTMNKPQSQQYIQQQSPPLPIE